MGKLHDLGCARLLLLTTIHAFQRPVPFYELKAAHLRHVADSPFRIAGLLQALHQLTRSQFIHSPHRGFYELTATGTEFLRVFSTTWVSIAPKSSAPPMNSKFSPSTKSVSPLPPSPMGPEDRIAFLEESIQALWEWGNIDWADFSAELKVWLRLPPKSSKLQQRIETYFVRKLGGHEAITPAQKPIFDTTVAQTFALF